MNTLPVRKQVRQDNQVVAGNVLINKIEGSIMLACKPKYIFPNGKHTMNCASWAEARHILDTMSPLGAKNG